MGLCVQTPDTPCPQDQAATSSLLQAVRLLCWQRPNHKGTRRRRLLQSAHGQNRLNSTEKAAEHALCAAATAAAAAAAMFAAGVVVTAAAGGLAQKRQRRG